MSRHKYCDNCSNCFYCDSGTYEVGDSLTCQRCQRWKAIDHVKTVLRSYGSDKSSKGQLARDCLVILERLWNE